MMKGLQLIINPGSSTLKVELFKGKKSLFASEMKVENGAHLVCLKSALADDAFQSQLLHTPLQSIAVRVVHGADLFKKPTRVSSANLKKLKKLDSLAPLHNPQSRKILIYLVKAFPRLPIWMIFDTSFHQSIPEIHQHYALPPELLKKYEIKRYGFHGISCSSILQQLRKVHRAKRKTIICHLGSGCSVTALKNGKSFATSMGYTPLEGLIMGTRVGDLDPGIVLALSKKGIKREKLEKILQEESGLKALAGTSDMREILLKAKKGNRKAITAFHLFCVRAAEYIARYALLMDGVDQIVFSGGIGENSPEVRQHICDHLKLLGIRISQRKNASRGARKQLQELRSRAEIYWMHADEAAEMNRMISG